MSVFYYIGSSNEKNSKKLYTDIIEESVKNLNTSYLVIVPEQSTLQTQKMITLTHPDRGMFNIDVLSFLRLAYRVFDEIKKPSEIVLEDTGKNMILRKLIQQNKDELYIFQGNVKKQGYISEIKSFISELLQYDIKPDKLQDMVEALPANNMLKEKLNEIHKIYTAFIDYLSNEYITAEEILDLLYELIDDSEIIRQSVIILDNFTGFTPIQNKLLEKIMKAAKKVIISVTIDEKEYLRPNYIEYSLFSMSKSTINKINSIAQSAGVSVEGYIDVDKTQMYRRAEEIEFLSDNLFRYNKKVFSDETGNIMVSVADNINREVSDVYNEIRRLVYEEGYRYREIAIISGDIEAYGRMFKRIFEKDGVPYFIDSKKSILDNPAIEAINAVFEIVMTGFSYESVFRYLRSSMSNLDSDSIDVLDNYVLALGKKGEYAWKKPWEATYRTNGVIDLGYINDARVKVYEELSAMYGEFMKAVTIYDYARALYNFMVHIDMEEKLERFVEEFESKHNYSMVKEYEQVYKCIIDLLDKMVELLADEEVSLKEFSEIFIAGISDIKIGVIPLTLDQIVVGDIERTRLSNIRALFFVGVSDNIIPNSNSNAGIVSELDRELLWDMGFELAMTKRQRVYIEQFYLYMTLTKPSERLYVSYYRMDSSGKSCNEAYIIGAMRKIMPKLNVRYIEDINPSKDVDRDSIKYILQDYGKDYLIRGLRDKQIDNMSDTWAEIFAWYKTYMDTDMTLNSWIDGAYYNNKTTAIGKAVAKSIYGFKDKSVTEIEKYAACAYAHFLQYGLKLTDRAEYELNTPDLGTIFHDALNKFSSKLKLEKRSWKDITENEQKELADICVNEATESFRNGILQSTSRNMYMIEKIKGMTRKTVWALCNHINKGDFEPTGFEVAFCSGDKDTKATTTYYLEDGTRIGFKGVVDRIDICREDDNEYVKIIDYKSGKKSFDPALFEKGVQLQLIVYMNVAIDKLSSLDENYNVVPAGAFYYTIDNPIVEYDDSMKKDIDYYMNTENLERDEALRIVAHEKSLDKLVMTGVFNDSPKIIELMDKDISDGETLESSSSSKVMKLSTNKTGEIKSNSMAITSKDFENLRKHAAKVIKQLTECMYNGEIDVAPYRSDGVSACDYCNYSGICKFDIKMEDNRYRNIPKLGLDGLLDKLKKIDSEDESIEKDNNDIKADIVSGLEEM